MRMPPGSLRQSVSSALCECEGSLVACVMPSITTSRVFGPKHSTSTIYTRTNGGVGQSPPWCTSLPIIAWAAEPFKISGFRSMGGAGWWHSSCMTSTRYHAVLMEGSLQFSWTLPAKVDLAASEEEQKSLCILLHTPMAWQLIQSLHDTLIGPLPIHQEHPSCCFLEVAVCLSTTAGDSDTVQTPLVLDPASTQMASLHGKQLKENWLTGVPLLWQFLTKSQSLGVSSYSRFTQMHYKEGPRDCERTLISG